MKNSRVFKAIVLTSSVTLVTVFLLGRSGLINLPYFNTDTGSLISGLQDAGRPQQFDTIPDSAKAAARSMMLSSSKSMILFESTRPISDSVKIKSGSKSNLIKDAKKQLGPGSNRDAADGSRRVVYDTLSHYYDSSNPKSKQPTWEY